MEIKDLSLAEIVKLKPTTASLFESYNVDYCCHGKQKLSQVLSKDPIRLSKLSSEIDEIFKKVAPGEKDFNSISLHDLADHILSKHHQYVKDNIPVISQHLKKLVHKHGDKYPHMKKISEIFERIGKDFEQHMMKEELILFPRIKEMETSFNLRESNLQISIEGPVNIMESEHEAAGNMMADIKKLSNNYTPATDACTTHRLCMEELKIFETDLHTHVHLENNILFPRAIDLEKIIAKSLKSCSL